ncbi:MAG: adenylyltransferase/cytidyltransferase family protein, partial [Endomicrobiia bacterium]|nr:adenylyltransferase/cytidyltransferase family protein [Endomicrobiia bacterium]
MRVVTVGNFDGVHLGHRRLIGRAAKIARGLGATCCAITFDKPFGAPRGRMLTSPDEKIELLVAAGADEIIMLKGDRELWNMRPDDFAKKILLPLKPAAIVAGYDFKFGKHAAGGAQNLPSMLSGGRTAKKSPRLVIERPLKYRGKIISSSAARTLIEAGDMVGASRLLGRFYSVSGREVGGRGVAGKLGFPTINLSTPPEKILPRGVFMCAAASTGEKLKPASRAKPMKCREVSRIFPTAAPLMAAAYIGGSPTLLGLKKTRVEFHLTDNALGASPRPAPAPHFSRRSPPLISERTRRYCVGVREE